jgi:DNA-binding NtrC family response regulator
VRVTVHPLESEDGRRLLGESLEIITPLIETVSSSSMMVGEAPAFRESMSQLQLAARSEFPVLLLGETGTGKELAAGFIHRNSDRAQGPYLTLDCTTVTDSLFEAEVFGHERGAFTGSVGEKAGLFERANGGTLFLDEIGELSANSQAKLLRALEKGEFRRVGGHRTRQSDVRVICATNRHLWELVEHGHFREDLYYRIACLTVHLPALSERREDISALARSFLHHLPRVRGQYPHITERALHLLSLQDYPGNIRQLRNVVFAAASRSIDGCIDVGDVETALSVANGNSAGQRRVPREPTAASRGQTGASETPSLAELERRYTMDLLDELDGNRRAVAERLGISTRTLYRRLKRYGLR